MLTKGAVLVSESNREYIVRALVSSGTGQGDIYRVSGEGREYALKLFYAGESEQMKHQIQVLMKRGQACPEYVHPLDTVWADERLGYIMEYIPDSYLSGSILYNGIETEGHYEELPFHIKVAVLQRLSEALAVLYRANLAMMDLKFDNLKINPEDWSIRILDTDTVVGSDDGSSVIEGTVGFMPPLTMRREESPNKHNDSYALAIMIFMSLLGCHPLMGAMWDQPQHCDIETYCFAENPIYIHHPTDRRNRPTEENERTVSKLEKYPERFLRAMERAFVDGLYDREKRPSPSEWSEILQELYDGSFCCMECGEEHFLVNREMTVCDACFSPLVKPLFIKGSRAIPLFLGTEISAAELWEDSTETKPFVKVAVTRYRGKYGLSAEADPVKLTFPNGDAVTFSKGKTVPLFTNAVYEYQNRDFTIQEG